ncbi:SAM-dependent methyltransferase [Actinomadura graeca]|uniref:SAM-dependent methyltransferase n=1 Tax=Actinomadura graeca TaxID=2750812 RepID=A0ABX8R503_9ACTN|nr:SAM-dependent methyltransferase [Actinomadura graeca]QXJ26160.1 SAM-dependent methyltransferase [Actinomadura graeca]
MTASDALIASPARVNDHLLGGKDNYAADRELAGALLAVLPRLGAAVRADRAFVRRAVGVLAARGIRQFLDVGCGLPTTENVHQTAARHATGARVVYVDNDPVVIAHARARLADDGDIGVVRADLRKPCELLDDAFSCGLLDRDEPVGMIVASSLHHLPDADGPHAVAAELRGALTPGGALVLSHLSADFAPAATLEAARLYTAGCESPLVPRGRDEIAAFFGDLEPLPPGLVPTGRWRPDGPAGRAGRDLMYAGLAIR